MKDERKNGKSNTERRKGEKEKRRKGERTKNWDQNNSERNIK
jgi:hypothetical protein